MSDGKKLGAMPTALREHGAANSVRKAAPSGLRAQTTMPHRKTCKRFNEPCHAHALTFSCFRRQPFLSKDGSRKWLVEGIDRAREKHHFHVWAYVVMPEHAHLLLWPTEENYDISQLLNSIKQSVAKRALVHVSRTAPGFLKRMEDKQPNGERHYRFWQRGGGYDRNIIEPASAFQTVQYLHNNPVRRGLCAKPEDWFWSSAADYAGVRVGPLQIDRQSLPVVVETVS
jgi:putative transposase